MAINWRTERTWREWWRSLWTKETPTQKTIRLGHAMVLAEWRKNPRRAELLEPFSGPHDRIPLSEHEAGLRTLEAMPAEELAITPGPHRSSTFACLFPAKCTCGETIR